MLEKIGSKAKKLLDVKVHIEASEAILVAYLKQKDKPFSQKAMVALAIEAFWLPLAIQNQIEYDDSVGGERKLFSALLRSIYYLGHQYQYLKIMTGIDPELVDLTQIDNQPNSLQPAKATIPSNDATSSKAAKLEIRVQIEDSEGFLGSYFKEKNKPFHLKETIAMPVRAFWLPLAVKYQIDSTRSTVAKDSINAPLLSELETKLHSAMLGSSYYLEQQYQYLKAATGVDPGLIFPSSKSQGNRSSNLPVLVEPTVPITTPNDGTIPSPSLGSVGDREVSQLESSQYYDYFT